MITIVEKYIILENKKNLNKEITKFIFKKLDIEKYIKMMNTSNNMPDNNMNRMFISYFRENLIAHLLNMKYVGDEKEWETDCVYPMNVQSPNEFHIKYEIKIQKNMFLKNGNTNGIILKNGRGEGSPQQLNHVANVKAIQWDGPSVNIWGDQINLVSATHCGIGMKVYNKVIYLN